MTVEQMRQYLLNEYPGSVSWMEKIKKMPDSQVIAIFNRISSASKRFRRN